MARTAQLSMVRRILCRLAATVVHTHLFVSAALGSLVLFAQHATGLPVAWRPALFCAAGVLAVYNFDDLIDPSPQRLAALPGRWPHAGGMALGLLGAAFWFPTMTFARLPWLYAAAILGALYAVPWRRPAGHEAVRRMKDIPGMKAWLVAGVITATTWGLAMGSRPPSEAQLGAWPLATIFVIVATNVHLCDVRDLHADRARGVRTLAALVGVGRLRWIFWSLQGVVAIFSCTSSHPELTVPLLTSAIYTGWLTPRSSPLEFAFWADGTLFLPAVLGSTHAVWAAAGTA